MSDVGYSMDEVRPFRRAWTLAIHRYWSSRTSALAAKIGGRAREPVSLSKTKQGIPQAALKLVVPLWQSMNQKLGYKGVIAATSGNYGCSRRLYGCQARLEMHHRSGML